MHAHACAHAVRVVRAVRAVRTCVHVCGQACMCAGKRACVRARCVCVRTCVRVRACVLCVRAIRACCVCMHAVRPVRCGAVQCSVVQCSAVQCSACVHECGRMRMRTHVRGHLCVCTCMRACVHVCVRVCTGTCARACMCACTCLHDAGCGIKPNHHSLYACPTHVFWSMPLHLCTCAPVATHPFYTSMHNACITKQLNLKQGAKLERMTSFGGHAKNLSSHLCEKCGNQLMADAKFCRNCGTATAL